MSDLAPIPILHVQFPSPTGDTAYLKFQSAFRIGRVDDCAVCIRNEFVSRNHAEVFFDHGQWQLRDLKSSNGIFVAGQRVETAVVDGTLTFRLGIAGPTVYFEVERLPAVPTPTEAPMVGDKTRVAQYVERYFGPATEGETVGEHTMYVRRAIAQVQKKQKSKYTSVIVALGLVALAVGGYALYEFRQLQSQKATALDLFYTMKSLDLDIANLQKLVLDSNSQAGMAEIRKYQSRRKETEKSYDRFLATLNVYDPKMTAQERLILRVTRVFGECELDMPHDFAAEVNSYIKKWQSSDRLAKAIRRAESNGYTTPIAESLLAQGLPPQFFYLALQESDFDQYISGPMTRKGIAKGMWQFIPETALKYGLHLGPLVDMRRPDPSDDRHKYEVETRAAVRYLKDLYSTDAQASGFLVMACYNWGEVQVLPLVRSMPANPRERNFWKLLARYKDKLPRETYDYVFYIVSAAVIGEDPHLFGFTFENPLGHLESK